MNDCARSPKLAKIGRFVSVLLAFLLLLRGPSAKPAQKASAALPMAKPEDVGFSSERLQRIHEAMQRHIDAGEIAGVVTLVSKNGKIVYYEAHGLSNIA